MEVKIDFTKSAQENANDYYARAKKLSLKREGAQRAIAELKKKLSDLASIRASAQAARTKVQAAPKEWYEKFHTFFTSSGMLVIGGRDAHQNEMLISRHFEDSDLFFHANIFGASPMILKGGRDAPRSVREEVAQFAACYSSAWKDGLSVVDVYAVRREQVSKSTSKGSLGTGSFLISGERDWYRSIPLSLAMVVVGGKLLSLPSIAFGRSVADRTARHVVLTIGNDKKSDAAKKIAKMLGYGDLDGIMQQLPTGGIRVSEGYAPSPN